MKVHDSLNVDVLNHVVQRRIDMSHRNKALVAIVAGTALLISSGAAIGQAAIADERSGKAMQTLNVDFATETGNFRGGASGTLYGLGDDGSPADAILDGAQVENSSQKPPSGTQHPSGDALALENQFFSNGGNELAVYMQDYYPDWSYTVAIVHPIVGLTYSMSL